MSKCYIFTEEELTALANSIRTKAGREDKMTMSEMCDAVRAIESATVAKYGVTDTYDFGELTETGTIAQNCKLFSKYVGYKITTISNSGFENSSIQEFDFPLLTIIGRYAFQNCVNLTRVEIQASVTSIYYNAFRSCTSLEEVIFLNSMTSLPDHIFRDCIKLKHVVLPSGLTSIGREAFQNCSDLALTELPDLITIIDHYAFSGCSNLELDKLPASLTSIGGYVFMYCPKVTIHEMNNDNWTSLPNYIFYYATGITHFKLPSALTSIPQYGFSNCTSLASVEIGDAVRTIGSYAFDHCTALETIDFNGVATINSNAFQYAGFKKLTIPSTITSIGSSAFAYCTSLEEVVLDPTMTSIPNSYIFVGCTSLKKVYIKKSFSSLNSNTFINDTAITDIYVPWASGAVSGAPWGATNATVHYDTVYDQDLISLSIDSGNILMTVGTTHQFEVVYNPDKGLVKEEQLGVIYSVISGSEYITVDNNGLATMIADAPEGTTMIVRATSTYNSEIYTDATLTVIAPYVEVDLNGGQWVDTGTTVDGHTVYQSDAGSYHVNSGLSRMTVTFEGYTSITAYIRSFAEGSYDYTELGPLDGVNIARGAGTNVLSTSSKQSSSTYYSHTYENDGGKHSFEVIYSKDSSTDSDDDRGYFYFVTN